MDTGPVSLKGEVAGTDAGSTFKFEEGRERPRCR